MDASAPAYQELTAGEKKTITVTYAVRDEEGATSQESFDIELTGTNDNPLLTGTPTTLPGGSEDTNYVVTKDQLLAGYTDADDGEGDNLTIGDLLGKDSSGASAGTFAPNNTANQSTQWTFTPVAHFNGTVNITYNVIDAQSGSTAASSKFDLASVNDTPTLTGTKTNFTTDLLSGTEDTEYSISKQQLLAGYTDADNDTMSILGLSATNGVITADGENYKFTPNPDFNTDIANITLNYVISDGKGGNEIVSNTLKIDAINDKPVRTAGNVGTLFLIEDAPLTSMGLGDVDYSVGGGSDESDQELSYTVNAVPDTTTRGTVFVESGHTDTDGATLSGKLKGPDNATNYALTSATVMKADGTVLENQTAVTGLTITAGTGAFTFDDQSYTIDVDERLEIRGKYAITAPGGTTTKDFLLYVEKFTDPNDATATKTEQVLLSSIEANETLTLDQLKSLEFLASVNAFGTAEFKYTVADNGSAAGDNENSIQETVTLDILGFNDTPVLPTAAITLDAATEDQNYTINATDLLEGVTDPDIVGGENPDGDVLVVDNLSVTNGTLTDNEDGTYTFRGDENFNGTAQLNYLIKDGQGGSISNTVNLTVSSVNDAPVATFEVDQNVAEGSSKLNGQLTATDVDTKSTNTADQVETKRFKFISAFIDDLDVYGATQASLSGSIKNAGGGALTDTDMVSFVSATIEKPNTDTSEGAAATVLETKNAVGDIGGLTFDANAETWAFDASHDDYSALAVDEMIEIIVEYKITNGGNETTNHFRLKVLPDEVASDGTTVTTRTAIYAKEVDTD